MSKKAGKCIFCGKEGSLSKEHVWPDWFDHIIPRNPSGDPLLKHQNAKTRMHLTSKEVFLKPELEIHNGHIGTRKLKKVCGSCNNGWMSKLQELAKPIVSSLILGQEVNLELASQETLSRWIIMTSIVAEFTDPPTLSIPASHRRILMEGAIPPGWVIWIGKYRGTEWKPQRYRHHGAFLMKSSDYLVDVQPNLPCNTQTSTFAVGELFIYAASTTISGFVLNFSLNIEDKLIQILPLDNSVIDLPPKDLISDQDAILIADSLIKQGLTSRPPTWQSLLKTSINLHLENKKLQH